MNDIQNFFTWATKERKAIALKGDVPGHEFHGNQWTGGSGGSGEGGGFDGYSSLSEDEYLSKNPHAYTFGGTAESRAQGFRNLPDDAEVIVFHATDDETADRLLKSGAVSGNKKDTSTGTDRFGPGQGLGNGVYVGTDPQNVSGYGKRILAIKVPKSAIEASPEQKKFGAHVDAAKALSVSDAIINENIPASSFVDVTSAGKYSRAYDAIKKTFGKS